MDFTPENRIGEFEKLKKAIHAAKVTGTQRIRIFTPEGNDIEGILDWMREQIGLKGLLRTLRDEAPRWATMLPQLPRLLHRALADDRVGRIEHALEELLVLERRRNRLMGLALALAALALAGAVASALT